MPRGNFDHGFREEAWEAARAEAREAKIAVAVRRRRDYKRESCGPHRVDLDEGLVVIVQALAGDASLEPRDG